METAELERANDPGYGSGGGRTYDRYGEGDPRGGQFAPTGTSSSGRSPLTSGRPYVVKPKGGGGSGSTPRASSKFKTLGMGEDNDPQAVAEMQQLLTALGLGNLSSGTYDKDTEAAVMEAQRRLGVKKPNGKVSKALVNKMLAAYDLSPCVKRSDGPDLDDIERGHPHPGQRYRHGWIPIHPGADTSRKARHYGSEKEAAKLTPADRRAIGKAHADLDEARSRKAKRAAVADLSEPQLRDVAASLWLDPDEAPDRHDLADRIAGQVTTRDVTEGIDPDRRTGGSDQLHTLAADRVAEAWHVSPSDLEALLRQQKGGSAEGSAWDKLKDDPIDEQKRSFLKSAFFAYDSGAHGSPPLIMAMAAVSRRHGFDYKARGAESKYLAFGEAHPDLQRAIDSLGDAIYDTTQRWFHDRGITHVRMRRYTNADPAVERGNIYRAWSVPGGGGFHQAHDHEHYIEDDVPVSRIFSIPATGPGSPEEAEVVVLSQLGDAVMRAVGADVTPGHDELHHYWTHGEGLAKWADSPKPWTTLVAHLTEHVGSEKAKVFASRWFHEVFGFYAGSDLNRVTHGHPPRGDRVGPG